MSLLSGIYPAELQVVSDAGVEVSSWFSVTVDGDEDTVFALSDAKASECYGSSTAEIQELPFGHLSPFTEKVRAIVESQQSATKNLTVEVAAKAIAVASRGYRFALYESVSADDSATLVPWLQTGLSIDESIEVSDMAELVPWIHNYFNVSERVSAGVMPLLVKWLSAEFNLAEGSRALDRAELKYTYDEPSVIISVTDLADLAVAADQAVNLSMYQGGWHKLIFPITSHGERVKTINNAKLELFRGPSSELALTLNNGIEHQDGMLIVTFDDANTADLTQNYDYELWVEDTNENPLFVSKGTITFVPTRVRFN